MYLQVFALQYVLVYRYISLHTLHRIQMQISLLILHVQKPRATSSAEFTIRIPRPPPPRDALMIIG